MGILSLSTARAAEEELEDGIAPYEISDELGLVVLSDFQRDLLTRVVDKVVGDSHYVVCPYVNPGNFVNYYILVGDDVSLSYISNSPRNRIISIDFSADITLYNLTVREKSDIWGHGTDYASLMALEPSYPSVARVYTDPYWSMENWYVSVDTYTFAVSSVIYSDLGYFPDISSREEVQYDHATAVILASFLLLSIFRSWNRSIRGRVD